MNVRLYANTSTLALTERLEGGSFQPPLIPAYADIQMRFKLVEVVNSLPTRDRRALHSLVAKIGWPDEAPVSGAYQLEITLGEDSVTTADIAYNATAAQIATAINTALGAAIAALNPCTVSEYEGLFRIVFADKTERPTFACVENELWPASFVEVDEIDFDEGYAYVLQIRQAPVAETVTYSEEVPTAPTITRLQAGVEVDGFAINEIQKLAISPAFAGGSFRIVRSGKKTAPIAVPAAIDRIRAAVAVLADDGGAFLVTEVDDGAYLEFQGEMGGTAQDLMTVEVFESPGVDYFFHLPTKTDSMRTLMRVVDTSGQVRIPLSLELEITDPLAPGGKQEVPIQQELIFIRPVPSSANNVAASLRYTQPLSRGDYLKHSTNALLVAGRAAKFTIGDGSTVSFALPHNLVENPHEVTANATTNRLTAAEHNYQNLDPVTFSTSDTLPAPLDATKTYFVLDATADDFQVSLEPNGDAVDLTTTGTGTHTVRLKDGTIEHVAVEVWETAEEGERLPQSSYTAARTSLDVVTVSGFPSTPTAGQYDVVIQTYGRPATYQKHTHEIDETPEAKTRIEALEARMAALESAAGNLGAINSSLLTGGTITRTLGGFFAIPGALELPAEPPAQLRGWTPYSLEENPLDPVRLLPAVHVLAANVEALPNPLPRPSAEYAGRVFTTAVARNFPGGGLLAGDYAACDGRTWYRVARQGSETTWYPTIYEIELFRFAVTTDEMVARSVLDLAIGFEAAIYTATLRQRTRRTGMQWTLRIEHGVATSDSTPATTGANLDTYFSSPVTMLEHTFRLSEVPQAMRYGIQVTRPSSGDITAVATKFFKGAACAAPSTGNFAIRAILTRGDVEDVPTDPKGLVAVRGLDVGADGTLDPTLGRYTITS